MVAIGLLVVPSDLVVLLLSRHDSGQPARTCVN